MSQFPTFVKAIRIAVTGDVLITDLEKEIIDTPDFQRLRGVRQLGPALHVYPTAVHTRFDHALGTLAMADSMVRAIQDVNSSRYKRNNPDAAEITDEQRILARLYGLLHDIAHVPFGHTIEDELGIFARHDAKDSPRFERFLGEDSRIGELIKTHLTTEIYERFKRIYLFEQEERPKDGDEFIYDLVSNTLCADLLDYVRRDPYFCNLDIYFEYRFLNSLYLYKDEKKRRSVFIRLWKGDRGFPRRDTLTDLTRLLTARYMIAERVYFHPAKIISGTMIGRAIQEVKLAGELKEEDLYRHTDDTLVHFLADNERVEVARRLTRAYRDRRLYKTVYKFTKADFDLAQSQDYSTDVRKKALEELENPDRRHKTENEIANDIGAKPGDVLIYAPQLDMNMKLAKINVFWKGTAQHLKDIDDPVVQPQLKTILEAHKMLWAIHLLIDPDIDEKKRKKAQEAFEERFLTPPSRRAANPGR